MYIGVGMYITVQKTTPYQSSLECDIILKIDKNKLIISK